jgi:two-component system, NarL family, sensor histidine kinase DegS
MWILFLVALGTSGLVAIALGAGPASQVRASQTALLFVTLAIAAVAVSRARGSTVWTGSRLMAGGLVASGIFQLALWLAHLGSDAALNSDALAGALGTLLAVSIGVVLVDFGDHLRRGRPEVASDVALVAALVGGIAYLLISGSTQQPASQEQALLSAIIGFAAVLALSSWCVLALWVPSRGHYALAGGVVLLAVAALSLDWSRAHRGLESGTALPAVLASAALLAIGTVIALDPRLSRRRDLPPRETWWIRPSLLTMCLAGACVTLGVALMTRRGDTGNVQAGVLLSVVALLVAARSFMSRGATARATAQLATALREREDALESVRRAVAEVASSEARLRLLLDAAVDGVMELDGEGVVVRVNDAFCTMIQLQRAAVVGHPWNEVAGKVPGTTESMVNLPTAGGGELTHLGRTVYLEARSSPLPADPPGTLLFVRDVTATKVADQTIRTLFQFLQDRDEDRTRLLRRTNATIESERNRIARDLHDGPIQGISAAALSLEAVKMMLNLGDEERAADMLGKVRSELSDEAESLRRLMSNLRPPLLEERGLMPAVIELCERFERDESVKVTVQGVAEQAISEDVEVLAYRVVQESLTNVNKHADAKNVTVRIEGTGGTLLVEVTDDGQGFDATRARDFLRKGKVGLASMRERTELGAGTFTIRSRPGRGTTVTASLPYEILGSIDAGTKD